jgi:lipopolysaccharide export system permease protein
MLSLRQLGKSIDSLKKIDNNYRVRTAENIGTTLHFTRYLDTGWVDLKIPAIPPVPDTSKGARKGAVKARSFRSLLPDSARADVLNRAISEVSGLKSILEQPALLYENEQNDVRLYLIAWHEKLTLSVACLVMFLIGAPLGSIIRKGGIGLPLIFAVVFFVVFFLLNNFGKRFVKQDIMTPLTGMWLATFVLTPIGLFLIYKALHDSQLFNKEFYFRILKNIRPLIQRISHRIPFAKKKLST